MLPWVILVIWPIWVGAGLQVASCATWTGSGSVYRGRCTHVGVRPAYGGPDEYGATVQVTTDAPWCPP